MWIVNKIILVFTLFLINTFSAYGESFQLICDFNKSTDYDFRKWAVTDLDEKYLIIQNHLIIDNKAIFKQRNISTKWSNRQEDMSTKDIYKIASKQTVMVVCHR